MLNYLKRLVKRIPGAVDFTHELRPKLESLLGERLTKRLINPPEMPSYPVADSNVSTARSAAAQPTVTVVVPNYNDESYLSMCLESVRQQDYPHIECIVVDDCSTDGSLEIINHTVSHDPRFKLIRHKANGGLSAARNTGIVHATGEYITFLDADDYLYKGSIRRRAQALSSSESSRVVASYCAWDQAAETETRIPSVRAAESQTIVDFMSNAGDCPFIATAPMLKTSVVRAFKGFDENLTQAEDWDLWCRLLRHGFVFVPAGCVGVAYRQKRQSMIRREPWEHFHRSSQIMVGSHSDSAPDIQTGSSPFYYTRGWAYYTRLTLLGTRWLATYAMARYQGDQDAVSHAIETVDAHDWQFLKLHLNVESKLRGGIQRGFSGKTGRIGVIPDDADTLVETYRDELERAIIRNEPPTEAGSKVDDHQRDGSYDVLFFLHKDYHVWSANEMVRDLMDQGLSVSLVDMTYAYRDEGARRKIRELNLPQISYNSFLMMGRLPSAVVCFNDWDHIVVRPLFEDLAEKGVETIGIVEGVQDFEDADTGRTRRPYRTVKHVLLAGEYDKRFFLDSKQAMYVVGVPRIKELLDYPVRFPTTPLVIINQNFTYGVLTEHAQSWLESVRNACEQAGTDYIVSRHPADHTNLDGYNTSTETMYQLIDRGTVFVSRFSSGILESLAMGKPVIYHNPHGEKVDKFHDGMGVYATTANNEQLIVALEKALTIKDSIRQKAMGLLQRHCNVGDEAEPHTIASRIISEIARGEATHPRARNAPSR